MPKTREKFATQVDADLLHDVRVLAKEEGRQLQALVDEALADLVAKHRDGKARPPVMNAYQVSHARFGLLYEKLAK